VAEFAKIFFAAFIWVLFIGINTRIVAHRTDFLIPAFWSMVVGIVWVIVIREVIFAEHVRSLAAYPIGAALATGLVTKFVPSRAKWLNHDCKEKEDNAKT
jgi:Na+/citrate or Na+/malate symporter